MGRRYCVSSQLFHLEYIAAMAKALWGPMYNKEGVRKKDGSVICISSGLDLESSKVLFVDTTAPVDLTYVIQARQYSLEEYLATRHRCRCEAIELRIELLADVFRARCSGDSLAANGSLSSDLAKKPRLDDVDFKPRLMEVKFAYGADTYVFVSALLEHYQGHWAVVHSVSRVM